MTGTRKRTAALFSTNFLEYSQTFIYDQIRSHQRYEVDVFTHNRLNQDLFPYDRVTSLAPCSTLKERAEHLLYGVTTYSPTFMERIGIGHYDVIHAHFGPGSIYAMTYKHAAGSPLVVTYHGYDVPLLLSRSRYLPQNWRYWLLSKVMFRRVDRFLAASDELGRLLIELGAPEEKVRTWRLGVAIPRLETLPKRSGREILMVGRLVEKKGFEYGIEAVARLLSAGVDCRLTIIGGGPLRRQHQQMVGSLRIGDRVDFLGVMSHEAVQSAMEKTDILLAPSVTARNGDQESGLMVAKEASARCVPVVGTLHGGIPEIVDHGETGFLSPERDAESLARHLGALLEDSGRREAMGRAARAKMEREYNIVDRVRALEQHYDEVIEEYR